MIIKYLILLSLLSGCGTDGIQQASIENYGLVGIVGYDLETSDNNQYKVTVALPQSHPEAEELTQVFTVIDKEPYEAMLEIARKTEKALDFSQLRVILFSEDLVREKGILGIMERLYRDPNIGANVYIGVTKGPPEEVIKGDYKDKPQIILYLHDLMEPHLEATFRPFTTIHDFIYEATDRTSDPKVPYLEKIEGTIDISHVALFENDKMVDLLKPDEGKYMQAMARAKRLPSIGFNIQEKSGDEPYVALDLINSRSKIKSNGDLENPMVNIRLKLDGMAMSYTGEQNLEEANSRKIVEDAIGKRVEEECLKLIKKLQELKVDPVRFSESFRSRVSGDWSEDEWRNVIYPKVTFEVEATIEITSTGILE
jgi:spore germination protein